MHIPWEVLMAAVGLFMVVCNTPRSKFIVYCLLVARAEITWVENAHRFLRFAARGMDRMERTVDSRWITEKFEGAAASIVGKVHRSGSDTASKTGGLHAALVQGVREKQRRN